MRSRREAEEEIGIPIGKLQPFGPYWASPGAARERVHLFLAAMSPTDGVSRGGGREDENEQMEASEFSLPDLLACYQRGELPDMKTALLLLELLRRQPGLFERS
jgi:8-oxo-dGTP pyrophosphatase MutT (NUDIX family)